MRRRYILRLKVLSSKSAFQQWTRAMYKRIYSYLRKLKSNTTDETNGRHIVPYLVVGLCGTNESPSILDVGAGYGKDLLAVKREIPQATVSAVEGFPQAVAFLRESGVQVATTNLERQPLPFPSNSFDVVICNQVLEHTKELFWLTSELARVCKVEGYLIIGVPNLGSLHNRIALLLGRQPPAIQVFGPHVRGFTIDGVRDFLHTGNMLRVERVVGGNFYPFPPSVSRALARWLPGLAVSSFFAVCKLSDIAFLSVLDSSRGAELVDTPYFRGLPAG
jgi:SAM-dependent methyltransferase